MRIVLGSYMCLLFAAHCFAQPATATWQLTADIAASTTGNITASSQVLSDTMSVRDFLGGTSSALSPVGAAERIWRDSLSWPQESAENNSRYIQFTASPVPGVDFIVQSIAINAGCSGTDGHFFANIYCSTESSFGTRTQLNSSPVSLPDIRTYPLAPLSYSPDVTVGNGHKIYLRIYPWYNSTPSPAKYVCLTGVVISGITATPGLPALSVFPASLSFDSIPVGSAKELTYTLSGSHLVPESGSIAISASTGFEVSRTNGSGYSASITVSYSGATLAPTAIYVKFAPDSISHYNSVITQSGGNAIPQEVSVSGTGIAAGAITGIFVSTDGSDSSAGSFDHPFRTIQKAIAVAGPGDTIFVRGGTYTLNSTIGISKSGTSVNRYFLFAYRDERPILDFSSMAFGSSNRGIGLNGSYWHMKGLEIKGAGDNGMNISGSHNIVEFCSFYENQDSGLQLSGGAADNRIINCDSYDNFDAPNSGGNADGFSPKLDVGSGNLFFGCRSWQNSDDGYDGYLSTSNDITTTYENCWAFMNGYLKTGAPGGGNGNGFKMGGNYLMHNTILKNCLSFMNLSKGFDQNHNRGSMTLYNCTGVNNRGIDFAVAEALNTGKTLTLVNCLELGVSLSINAAALQTTNSWQGFLVTAADFLSVDTAGVRGPRKADGSLPDVNFMHLSPTSDCINRGTDVGLPYIGSAPDLGCFESDVITGVIGHAETPRTEFRLLQNYPNPFNPSTVLQFSVSKKGFTRLAVVNAIGQRIATLFSGNAEPDRLYTVQFNAESLPTGLYLGVLEKGGIRRSMKMALVK